MSQSKQSIHHVLAKSYLVYLFASLVGLLADGFINLKFHAPFTLWFAIACFALGPAVILWAQRTSRHYEKEKTTNGAYFNRGPYRFVRNPTHVGLLILVTGYTLVSGSVIFFGVTLIGFLVSNIFFTKYESILSEAHGSDYQKYRSSVPKI